MNDMNISDISIIKAIADGQYYLLGDIARKLNISGLERVTYLQERLEFLTAKGILNMAKQGDMSVWKVWKVVPLSDAEFNEKIGIDAGDSNLIEKTDNQKVVEYYAKVTAPPKENVGKECRDICLGLMVIWIPILIWVEYDFLVMCYAITILYTTLYSIACIIGVTRTLHHPEFKKLEESVKKIVLHDKLFWGVQSWCISIFFLIVSAIGQLTWDMIHFIGIIGIAWLGFFLIVGVIYGIREEMQKNNKSFGALLKDGYLWIKEEIKKSIEEKNEENNQDSLTPIKDVQSIEEAEKTIAENSEVLKQLGESKEL